MKSGNTKSMSIKRYAFTTLSFSALALTLVACATDAPPPPAPPPPPPPAPVAPPVALAPEVSEAAAVYIDYMASVRGIHPNFSDAANVQDQLRTGETYEPKQLARGAVAYGAIIAMQDQDFRDALRSLAADPATRSQMVARLISDPSYVGTLATSDNAARRVIQGLSSDGAEIYKSGAGVKQAAYDIQHQGWSKEFVSDRDGRLTIAKQNSVTLRSVQSDQSARLLTAALTGQGLSSAGVSLPTGSRALVPQATTTPTGAETPSAPSDLAGVVSDYTRADIYQKPYTQTVNEALTIAALAVMGEGGADKSDTLVQMMDQNEGATCLSMSKLNLYQCLAVAKPHYEDVFCLGQHVLMDTGQCIGKMSSGALSLAPVVRVGFKADGSSAYSASIQPYLKPEPVAKKKKGKGKATTSAKKKKK